MMNNPNTVSSKRAQQFASMQAKIEADIARCEQIIALALQLWPEHPTSDPAEGVVREAHILLGNLKRLRARNQSFHDRYIKRGKAD